MEIMTVFIDLHILYLIVIYIYIYVTNSRAKPQQHLLDSQSFEFEICILQALNVPLLRCTNVFFQGRLSRHITSPSEKTGPDLCLGTTRVRQLRSGKCHYPTAAIKCNEQPSQATANPVGEKACSSTKGGLLRYILNTYSISQSFEFEICILQALNMPLLRCTNVFFQGRLSRHIYMHSILSFIVVFCFSWSSSLSADKYCIDKLALTNQDHNSKIITNVACINAFLANLVMSHLNMI